MKRIWLVVATLSAGLLFGGNQTPHAEQDTIDLSRWTRPDIGVVGDDPFSKLVKYGHKLFTDTANEVGPSVPDPAKRLAGNNLASELAQPFLREIDLPVLKGIFIAGRSGSRGANATRWPRFE